MTMRLSPPLSALLLSVLLLTACGFHLRGKAGMPFSTLYLEVSDANTPFVQELRLSLESNKVKLVEGADNADVVLNIVSEFADKQILSLGGSGRVSEFQLRYRVSFRAYDSQQRDWMAPDELSMSRDFSFDDTKLLSKEAEEAMIVQSMRSDMVQQIVRRLSRAKPKPKAESNPSAEPKTRAEPGLNPETNERPHEFKQ